MQSIANLFSKNQENPHLLSDRCSEKKQPRILFFYHPQSPVFRYRPHKRGLYHQPQLFYFISAQILQIHFVASYFYPFFFLLQSVNRVSVSRIYRCSPAIFLLGVTLFRHQRFSAGFSTTKFPFTLLLFFRLPISSSSSK